jgi:hypothetical protein
MKKNILKISSALLLSVFVLTSCNKTVTPKKLDGEWSVTGGSHSYSSSYNGNTYSSSSTFDGTTVTTTEDGDITKSPMSISYTFDKKAGTYKKVTTETSTDTYLDIDYYTMVGTTPTLGSMSLDKKIVEVSTSTEEGTFTITGGTGDIEKNTQIVLVETSSSSVSTKTYSYFNGATAVSVSDKYELSYNTGLPVATLLPTSKTSTYSDSGDSSYGEILTVVSLKKGVMEVTEKQANTSVSGATTESYSSDVKWTLTAK